jgi:hypothetical protein
MAVSTNVIRRLLKFSKDKVKQVAVAHRLCVLLSPRRNFRGVNCLSLKFALIMAISHGQSALPVEPESIKIPHQSQTVILVSILFCKKVII